MAAAAPVHVLMKSQDLFLKSDCSWMTFDFMKFFAMEIFFMIKVTIDFIESFRLIICFFHLIASI